MGHPLIGEQSRAAKNVSMEFREKPFEHQLKAFNETTSKEFYALFWEQGTGKSMEDIIQTAALYEQGKINGLLVVAPDGVHFNWKVEEIPRHMPLSVLEKTLVHAYDSAKAGSQRAQAEVVGLLAHEGLAVLCMSYSGFMTERGKKTAWEFLKRRRCMYTLDESGRIKAPKAKRTKSIVASGKHAPYRRILTGTPIANGPFDVYTQMKFLHPNYWVPHGLGSFAAFKTKFGVWEKARGAGGREFDLLVGYQNLEELYKMLEPHSSRLLKEDVLDLPPKLYSRKAFSLTPTQDRMYRQLRDEYLTMMDKGGPCEACGGTGRTQYEGTDFFCATCGGKGDNQMLVTAELAITRMLRLQQILCGYVPDESGNPFHDIPGGNPRLDLQLELLEDTPHQAIVWARFRRDIDMLCDALGKKAARYDGTNLKDRERMKAEFKGGERQFFVANPAAAGEGHTLIEAKSMFYYNNSFKLTERLQSEDRAHRAGQTVALNIVDLYAPGTIDELIIEALRKKLNIASQVLGDKFRNWMTADAAALGL